MPLTPGTRLGRYEVVRLLGAGGMGEVYLAKDDRLEREVALKVLPSGTLADEAARRRFHKEALALSRLNHANIGTIHDFDTQEGVDFLVMEYVPGLALAEKLASGPLPEKEVASFGAQIASALEEAHEQGLVHRDLKPANVLVTPKGAAKVLDFGLARLLRPSAEGSRVETLSQTESIAGTMLYMAPEQLLGERVDGRTDLWALGAVMYEMATGRRAFPEETAPRLTEAILHRPPPAPRALNPSLSGGLERIILKCLEKEPENRYQSAREVTVDLRRLSSPSVAVAAAPVSTAARTWRNAALAGGGIVVLAALLAALNVGGWRDRVLGRARPGRIESLAVLPLEDLSGDPDQEYFADGMTEELISALAKVGSLKVISRTSIMRYKGVRKPLPDIARELGVEAIVEGTVRRSGNRVRVTTQLIHAPTDRHLWSESYERDLRDILALQSDVARAIAGEIKVTLTAHDEARLAGGRPVDPEAYEACLRGEHYSSKVTEEGLRKGIEYFEQAIQRDAGYARAHLGLAFSYSNLSVFGALAPREGFGLARAATLRALELDEALARAHLSAGYIAFQYDWDWRAAESEDQRAIQLDPGDSEAHHGYANYLAAMGRFDEAAAEIGRARSLDPVSVGVNNDVAWISLMARRYDDAIQQYHTTLELEPSFVMARRELGLAYTEKGMFNEAIATLEEATRLSEDTTASLHLGHVLARAGRREEASRLLEKMLRLSKERYVSPVGIAWIYTGLGEKDQAFEWLLKAYQERFPELVYLKVDPLYDSLRSDPRFGDLLRRVGFPPDSGSDPNSR